jgi:hypothetical protein
VWIAASVIPALLVAAAGGVIASTPEEPIVTRVLDPGFEQVADAEPQRIFIVCTTRAGTTTCMAVDLAPHEAENSSN